MTLHWFLGTISHFLVHAVSQQAVCVEHDPVWHGPLAGQRHSRGWQPPQDLPQSWWVINNKHFTFHLKLNHSSRLMSPTNTGVGLRIGMVYDRDYFLHFLEHGRYPPLDIVFWRDSNSGVFLIKPGDATMNLFLYSLLMIVQTRRSFFTISISRMLTQFIHQPQRAVTRAL